MNHKPIVLWEPKATLASDDACTTILQYKLPRAPSTIRPPYQSPHGSGIKLRYVPPLVYFCIRALAEYPDQIHALGAARLFYEAPRSLNQFDILSALIPTYRPFDGNSEDFDMTLVDPRLWAVLIQVFEGLPPVFRQYKLPLSDAHLPLLQTIPSTKHFSLITCLSLTRCKTLSDDTVMELRHLHTLAALDVSVTGLGTWGISRLAKSLAWTETGSAQYAERRGPWGLRVLDLRNCINIDDKVFQWLDRFPLLSVVDMRGTVCRPWQHPGLSFKPSTDTHLYNPTSLSVALQHLASTVDKRHNTIFSHPAPFVLDINALHHKPSSFDSRLHPLNDLYCAQEGDEGFRPVQTIGRRKDVFQSPAQVPTSSYSREEEPHHGPAINLHEDSPDTDENHAADTDLEESDVEGPQVSGSSLLEADLGEADANWMAHVAEDEGNAYLRQRNAAMFYAPPKPQSAPRRISSLPDIPSRSTAPQAKADPLMLFRPPPPWSALPTAPSAGASSSAAKPHGMPESPFVSSGLPSLKRKRSGESAPAPADQARRRMHALSSIQSLFSMVQKRERDPGEARVKETRVKMVVPGRVNPFARTAQAGKQKTVPAPVPVPPSVPGPSLKRKAPAVDAVAAGRPAAKAEGSAKRASVPLEKVKTRADESKSHPPPSVKKPPEGPAVAPSPQVTSAMKSKSSAELVAPHSAGPTEPPRPSKKLKPITSLTVPEWPNAHHKPLTHYAPKPKPPQPTTRVQTTLPAVPRGVSKPGKPSDKAKEKRRVSAPVVTTPKLDMVAADKPVRSKQPTVKSKGENSKTATLKGGKGKQKKGATFDWKGWGAG